MTVMELKGNFHDLIAKVDDPELLSRMFEQCLGIMKDVDMLDDMPADAIMALEVAIAESYQSEAGVSHEVAKQLFKKWGDA
ncbi:MAG: hypothetical protein J0L99_01645 [Chitinophagales bacterium]|nr:hypothetical protein [Chitinophagales bacterium]